MIVEKFSNKIVASRLLNTYVAASFFAIVIFFVVNINGFTPIEMMISVIISTIVFKSIANIMLSMTIALLNLDNKQDSIKFEESSNRIESLVKDLAIQDAAIQSQKDKNKIVK
jgi:type II secretory pathway component PulJ